MTDPKSNAEPSMEEILASIRQIINQGEDKPEPAAPEPEAPAAAAAAAEPPAPASAPASVLAAAPAAPAEPERVLAAVEPPPMDGPGVLDDILELTDVVAEPPPPPPEPAFAAAHDDEDHLLSERAENAATSAISRHLSDAIHKREAEMPRHLPIGNGEATLEDMVLELLRPMLKVWLDTHLPEIVERIVRREVAKLVRRVQEDL